MGDAADLQPMKTIKLLSHLYVILASGPYSCFSLWIVVSYLDKSLLLQLICKVTFFVIVLAASGLEWVDFDLHSAQENQDGWNQICDMANGNACMHLNVNLCVSSLIFYLDVRYLTTCSHLSFQGFCFQKESRPICNMGAIVCCKEESLKVQIKIP